MTTEVSTSKPSTAKALYRAVMPRNCREWLWEVRNSGPAVAGRRIMRACRTALGAVRPEVRLPIGRMTVDLRDCGVGQRIYDYRAYEPAETEAVLRRLRPGTRFVDVGANIGYYSLLASRVVGTLGRVLAIEPEDHNYRILAKNIARNRLENVTAVQLALGAEPGHALIGKSKSNFGDHRVRDAAPSCEPAGNAVRLAAFDDLIPSLGLDAVDFVKIDVQGYECHVLRGMRKTLSQPSPLSVLCEFWPFGLREAGGSAEEFLDAFRAGGFRSSLLCRDGREIAVPLDELSNRLPTFDPADADGCFINVLFDRT